MSVETVIRDIYARQKFTAHVAATGLYPWGSPSHIEFIQECRRQIDHDVRWWLAFYRRREAVQ